MRQLDNVIRNKMMKMDELCLKYFQLVVVLPLLVLGQDKWFQQEPFVRYEPQDLTVSMGGSITLSCGVMGYPPPTVTWFKDNKPYNLTADSVILPDHSLSIDKARRNSKENDGGVYYCIAKNKAGSYRSRNATVIIKYIGNNFLQPPTNNTVSLRDRTIFKCIPPPGNPVPTVSWYKDGSPLLPNNNINQKKVGSEYHLVIADTLYMDAGSYACIAKNSEGERRSAPAVLKFKVTAPDIQITSNEIKAYEGKEAEIHCQSFKPTQPKRIWSKIGGQMPPKSRKQETNDGYLRIMKTKLSDGGKYECLAKNEVGQDSAVGTLRVYKQPFFQVMPASVSVGAGQTAHFDCVISGGKSPILRWDHKGMIYTKIPDRKRIFVNDKNQLVIPNVDVGNAGFVQCSAQDFAMTIKSSPVQLSVLPAGAPPPSIQLTPARVKVVEGGSFTLSCSGSNNLKFEWYNAATNEKLLSSTAGVKMKVLPGRSDLTLSNAVLSDSSVYRCKAIGVSGSVTKMSTVIVNASDTGKPWQVPSVTVVDIKSRSVKLIWTKPTTKSLSPVTSYIISIRNVNDGTEKKTAHLRPDVTEKIINELSPSTVYNFAVAAINKNGAGVEKVSENVETLKASATPQPGTVDKLEDLSMQLSKESVTFDSITVTCNSVDPKRIKTYILFYRKLSEKYKTVTYSNDAKKFTLNNLEPATTYILYLQALNSKYSSLSPEIKITTSELVTIPAPIKVGMQKVDDSNLQVYWSPPPNFKNIEGVIGFKVISLYVNTGKVFFELPAPASATRATVSGMNPWDAYKVYVTIDTTKGMGKPSTSQYIRLGDMSIDEVKGVPLVPPTPKEKEKEDDGILKIVKQPWFIAICGVLIWLLLLVTVVLLCCRHRKGHCCRRSSRRSNYESQRGLIGANHPDFPNTSLRIRNGSYNPPYNSSAAGEPMRKKKGMGHCCKRRSSSLDEDFPNRADIKPLMTYTRNESVEMRPKGNSDMKENNVGLAMKNGYMVDTPLNNELDYRQSDNRMYDGTGERPRYRMPSHEQSAPGSGSMPRREQRYQTDSTERRHAEIVRTAPAPKTFPETELVNVMENNPQATWKQEPVKTSPRINKPPGENTLRRQAKTQFKPLPKLEVLNWADGLPNSSQAASTNAGSETGSPKMSSSASMFSENTDQRTDSRMSRGGSSNSLNKYPYERRRRRNSNASSMMSSELYQSEMDPSGYSDVVSDRKRKKEKVPPPIDLEGLTSDILLQWAESVTNSSPSSSGSSSPDRLSGISSEGSIYTDEDFAQAVAATIECGGFNMEYDYSLPGMPGTQQPLSASRNNKMDKIDQVLLAQRSKLRNSPATTQNKPRDAVTPLSSLPQISMSGYLTGSHKGPQSTHSAPSGIPRASNKYKSSTPIGKHPARYGSGFQDVDSVSTASASKPLTLSNLLQHDSSLERDKKTGAKPLTVSNLRQHETSLDRQRTRQQPPAPMERPPPSSQKSHNGLENHPNLVPEAALSSISALERHESMNSTSKDSVNSSNRHDSEVENGSGTSERKPKNKKYVVNMRDPNSSTGTVSTVRSSPDHGDDTEC